MSQEKRLLLFAVVALVTMWAMSELTVRLGLVPPPPPPEVAKKKEAGDKKVAEAGKEKEKEKEKGKDQEKEAVVKAADEPKAKESPKAAPVGEIAAPKIAIVPPAKLALGSTDKASGYHLRLDLEQNGAGVARLSSALYYAEMDEAKKLGKHAPLRPLDLISYDPKAPPSFSVSLRAPEKLDVDEEEADKLVIAAGETPLDRVVWEVVADAEGNVVRPTAKGDGQEVVFHTRTSEKDPVVLTKTYRLLKGHDGFELELGFESPNSDRTLAYTLMGPHGLPIEGEWYTATYREAFVGQLKGGSTSITTQVATEIVKAQDKDNLQRFQTLPLKYAGIENQYFSVFFEPDPLPTSNENKRDAETVAKYVHVAKGEEQKADLSIFMTSKPFEVGPNRVERQKFKVFAGAKIAKMLQPYGAADLAAYRKSGFFFIPGASYLAQHVISPMLDQTYLLTKSVAGLFGGKRGSYGVAIILLTLFVRMCLFPLGRKMARSAQKMQQIAPQLKEIQAKYKDDKERATKEQFALYKRYGVNPVGGCLPALIQMPILVGLWQALNNSVSLRQAPFLWIDNLAAPDMLFNMGVDLPWIGHWFNVLPIVVVSLMLVQTKLFSPPATTPEAEMQQKMMKYMMVFMAYMFYKVPSGLGIYFITSSLWQISERLLLPKTPAVPIATKEESDDPPSGNGRGGSPKPGAPKDANRPKGWLDEVKEKVSKLLEDAGEQQRTVRNSPGNGNGSSPSRDDDRGRNRPKPKPGKRR